MKKFFCFQLAFLIFTHIVCIFHTLLVYKIQMHVFANTDTKKLKHYLWFSQEKVTDFFSLENEWIPMAGQLDSPRDDDSVELAEHLLLGCQAPLLHLLSVHNRAITIG